METKKLNEFKSFVLAGFTLCGWKLDDNNFVLGPSKNDGEIIDEFPKCIESNGVTYTLEYVEVLNEEGFVNAEYV